MTNKTLTRANLSEAIYNEIGLSRMESSDIVESVLDEISQSLVKEKMLNYLPLEHFQFAIKIAV